MNDHRSPAPAPAHPLDMRRNIGVTGLSVGLLLSLCCALGALAEPTPAPYRLGFTQGIFSNRNKNDMLAAMKSWSQTITRERGVDVDPDMIVFDSVEQAVNAVKGRRVDALILLLGEYSAVPAGLLSGPYFRDQVHGKTYVEFVLLGKKDGAVTELDDLRGARLIAHADSDVQLALDWLDARLAESGLGSASNVASGFERNPKLSATVLSVFFGKSDACLVTLEGFESMVELNPQLSRQLSIVEISPPVIPSLFCFRNDLDEARKTRLFSEITRLGESVTGQQVLRVFKADCMAEVTAEELDRSLALMNQWKKSVISRSPSTAGTSGN